jgi:hypothetical protein
VNTVASDLAARARGAGAVAQQTSESAQIATAQNALRQSEGECRIYDRCDWAFLLLAYPSWALLALVRLALGCSDELWRGGTLTLAVTALAHLTLVRSLQVRAERRRSEALAELRGLHELLDTDAALPAGGGAS